MSKNLIEKGTIVKVKLLIKKGGYNNSANSWTGNYATRSELTGSVYLRARFVILTGEHKDKSIYGNIGLYSPNCEYWVGFSKVFVKSILSSARNIPLHGGDPEKWHLLILRSLHELDGIVFLARVGLTKNQYGQDRNCICSAITPNNKEYKLWHFLN